MARAISLHVGVNVVGTGASGTLIGCVNDAAAMRDLPQLANFDRREFLTDQQATLDVVKARICQAAADLDSGGIFVFTFAGHGSFIGDEDGDEADLNDETLVLNDFMLVDDVLGRELWPKFKPQTRILMIADSCYSGTVAAFVIQRTHRRQRKPFAFIDHEPSSKLKALRFTNSLRTISEASRLKHLLEHRYFYERELSNLPQKPTINASIILLAACGDNETTGDGYPHGVFTQALLDVLAEGSPQNYDDFILRIGTKLKLAGHWETPVLTPAGQADPAFRAQRPFTI